MTFIGTNLSIEFNKNLTSIAALENITSIGEASCNGGGMTIWGNTSLTNLTGLDNITAIYGHVQIRYNPILTSLAALENVTYIGRNGYADLQIIDNASLTSLAGLENLGYNTIRDLTIENNANLNTCSVSSMCNFLTNAGSNTIVITGNATNCNSTSEILDICITPVNTPDTLSEVSISPNPGIGLFTISGITEGNYNLINSTGKIIQSGQLNSDMSIDISAIPHGVYFISISVDNQTVIKRVMKL